MNRLAKEKSPYLQQHARNPVDWYPWSAEALQKAKEEDKPIIVSIGYSTCHWCHVMEHESFEDSSVARFMNDNYINIKVDREERPDLDHLYMEVVQALTGRGGWPLNCFLTPDQKPFFGGTYFPPESMMGNPSWMQTLTKVKLNFQNDRKGIEAQAEKMLNYIKRNDNVLGNTDFGQVDTNFFTKEKLDFIYDYLKNYFDKQNGGFGNPPKFPSTMPLTFLLRYGFYNKVSEAVEHVKFSVDKMINGGIYDQIGGGLTRYSTDEKWLVPHFEKMLYDNGLFTSLLSECYTYFNDENYKDYIIKTLNFVERELLQKEGGFFAALDADSEGEEGRFYVWSYKELESILKENAPLIAKYYDISEEGNWEGKNIPHIQKSKKDFAENNNLTLEKFEVLLSDATLRLFEARTKRVRPSRDEKVILSWNMLMCSGFIDAFKALGDAHYLAVASKNLEFVFNYMVQHDPGGNNWTIQHSYKDGQAYTDGFLTDYALLIKTLIDFYQVTFEEEYLIKATQLTEYVIKNFQDDDGQLFYYTPQSRKDIILRKKEIYDAAIPSGNSVMMQNLLSLGMMTGETQWQEMAYQSLGALYPKLSKYGLSFGGWITTMLQFVYSNAEIVCVGKEAKWKALELYRFFWPHKLVLADDKGTSSIELLKNRFEEGENLFYLCQDQTCRKPSEKIDVIFKMLNE